MARRSALIALIVTLLVAAVGRAEPGAARFVAQGADGKLVYDSDRCGDRIPDFSSCGYGGGGVAIPDVPVRAVVAASEGDAGARIQTAIDRVSALGADRQGIRGAVLLLAGRHDVAGCLRITTGGVVLRGQGQGRGGTLLVATGVDRRPLIQIRGKSDRRLTGFSSTVSDRYVPVGARTLRLKTTKGLNVGDTILVGHPGTAAWIAAVGMDQATFPGASGWLRWVPGTVGFHFDRVVVRAAGDSVTLDAPVTTALDAALGEATVQRYAWPGRISHVGVENLRCESDFAADRPGDEEHAWMAVTTEAVQNAWVRQVTAVHFASSAVSLQEGCKWVTVEDCASERPVSEIGGCRRHSFETSGQLTLFQRCRAEHGRHDFAVGALAAGPNAFVECTSSEAHSFSGPLGPWASGVLYDNVTIDGGGLSLTNREIADQGAGWAGANCVLWQCTAPVVTCRKPPTAHNWAIGCWGQFVGDGSWRSQNQSVKPVSLYRAQLAERCGAKAVESIERRSIPAEAGPGGSRSTDLAPAPVGRAGAEGSPPRRVAVRNGWLVCGDGLLAGARIGTAWWRGSVLPGRAGEHGVGVTRFVPGRVGLGYTDDLDELTDAMTAAGQAALEHHWGLWYDRRRDDHQRVRRIDGDVWPPFYEQPWARSGSGRAHDGLSKYDLERFNPWYFGRLKQFAERCDSKGLLLIHQAYFQHNLLEAGAHWTDFPWRPANCLQKTGFPEPPPYVNGKRIFMAGTFYDVEHPVRRQLHRAYIRKCLETLGGSSNVLYLIGEEYTGPLSFARFWLDTAVEWQKETGRKVLLGLSCTKDVQDTILADPVRGPQVSVIDLRYWWLAADGSLYAPEGGQSLSPRQQLRQWKGSRRRSDAEVARQVSEYRRRYPDKAILCSLSGAGGWAVLAAGGSLPNLPRMPDAALRQALARMKPFAPPVRLAEGQWALAEAGRHYLVYTASRRKVLFDLTADDTTYRVQRLDPRTDAPGDEVALVRGGRVVELTASAPGALWLSRR
jgi:hypothetical protein